MADNIYPGAMVMVRIDGSKVRQLREQNGLTQLYIATAVQVTTDTISRWENKRYPTIKKENALKLAEALEVALEDILEPEAPASPQTPPTQDDIALPVAPASPLSKIWPLLLLSFSMLGIIASFTWFFFHQEQTSAITAQRVLPNRCTIGQPFPVVIEVFGAEEVPVAIILKELVPETVTILKTVPTLPPSGKKDHNLKWIHKAHGKTVFTYIARLDAQPADQGSFSGTIAASTNNSAPLPVGGNKNITAGYSHWADSDGNNVISDTEILAVYDQYNEIEQMGIDVDLIEEIWLGSGYKWNPQESTYDILP